MSYASALRGKESPSEAVEVVAPTDPTTTASSSSKPKKDKGERKSKKEKRSGIAPIDADEQDDETVRALRDKMAALHSQIAALEKRTTATATAGDVAVTHPVSGDLLSSATQPSSDTLAGGSSILTHVGLDGGSDGRFLAPSSGHLLGAGSDETLAVHSDEDDDGYNQLVSDSARYMTNSAADTPLNQQQQRRASPIPNNMTVGSAPTTNNTSMNPSAPSFTPNAAAAAFVPGSATPSSNNNNNNRSRNNHTYRPRGGGGGGYEGGSANPPTSTSRPSHNVGTTVTTMSVDPDADGDKEPLKSMSYNKNHHHDVVRDLMMLMKQQLALSKVRLGSTSNANDGIAERRLESGMSTRPGFAQFSKSSAELQEQQQTVSVQDEQRANAAAMVRSVLGEGAGSESSLSVSHTPDGKVHLTERLRSLADNPEEAARLLASLTEMEANEIAKEVFSPPTTKDYVVVEYKRERTKKFPCDIPVSPGDYVIVDGDRGTDCGLVVQVAKARPNHTYEVECMSSMVKNNVRKKMERGRVIRQATTDEIFSLHNEIAEVEKDALHLCRNKCIEHNIEVDLVDCEVQFDRKKVSFFFNSPIAVDFRALVRDLYNTFHIRIWMENVSPRVRNIEPFQVGGSSHNNNGGDNGGPSSGANRDSFSVGTNSSGHHRGGRGRGNSDHPARSFTGRGAGHHNPSHHHQHNQANSYHQQQQGGYDQAGGYGGGAMYGGGGGRGGRGGGGAPRYNQQQQQSHNGWGGQGQHDGAGGAGGYQLPNY